MSQKYCPRCGIHRDLEAFGKNKSRKDGVQSVCKTCRSTQMKEWYERDPQNRAKHRSLIKKNTERYRTERRDFVYEYLLTHPCIDCGEKDPVVLDFDHRNPAEKVVQISYAVINWSLARIQTEIDKCDVRCANCHRRRTASQFGWWKSEKELDSLSRDAVL